MTNEESLNIIRQALELATRKGCYGLQEVDMILQAIKTLETPTTDENVD